MLYSTDAITRVKIKSSDGAYGDIKDVYFDDNSWKMRYFVVDIGTWLTPRLVLISPEAIRQYSEDNKAFDTNLTKRQIMDSPAFDSQKTVS
ncbi:MAG: PRC-barrel domain-containing protein, partial [Pseudobdellovibrionaceae bacterium]|nr:PRC-barrel domain-containing protein [Pseudobdellovibrionaceae bacterium]